MLYGFKLKSELFHKKLIQFRDARRLQNRGKIQKERNGCLSCSYLIFGIEGHCPKCEEFIGECVKGHFRMEPESLGPITILAIIEFGKECPDHR